MHFIRISNHFAPASALIILLTGQPMLISIIAACVFSSTNLAASTNVSLSPPKFVHLKDILAHQYIAFLRFLFLNLIPLSLIISQTTNPAPNSFTVTRKAALLIPAIGLRQHGWGFQRLQFST